jgi:signal transduction histidine kinase
MTERAHPFRVKARVLRLLGDELIRDESLAVFELVKNAYDADARGCHVTLRDLADSKRAAISVEDDGSGMSVETVRDAWLVIGTDHRTNQRAQGRRTPKFHRLPLGEKGLGRLAVHKLGAHIRLITRERNGQEIVAELDWDKLETVENIENTSVAIRTREPEVFRGARHGTRIEVSRLREVWTRAKVRSLQRSTTSLCSPFRGPDSFEVALTLLPPSDWLDGLLDPDTVREMAIYRAEGFLEGRELAYDYSFVPLKQMALNVPPRHAPDRVEPLVRKRDRDVQVVDLSSIPDSRNPGQLLSLGKVRFDFRIFDLETEVLRLAIDDVKGFKDYLKENGGIRVYRDGVRVFDFGEPGNDWLNLDGRRVNEPVGKVSNRQILGTVVLDGTTTTSLVEKSNREGFIENNSYQALRDALLCALTNVEAERRQDQKRVRMFYTRRGAERPMLEELADLREALDSRGILSAFEPKVKAIEQQFNAYQDTLLRAAVPGLTFGTVIHEAEKLIKELVAVVRDDGDLLRIRTLVDQLAGLIDGLGELMRRGGTQIEKASTLLAQARFNCEFRFRSHKIQVVDGLSSGGPDFSVECSRRLVVGTLMNLIDNSIYWLEASQRTAKRIFLGTSVDLEGGPSLLVADNGPGFRDEYGALVQPFFSRKPDGMGLGLYLADEVAQRHKGRLRFPQPGDVSLPSEFTGAIVAFQFPEST